MTSSGDTNDDISPELPMNARSNERRVQNQKTNHRRRVTDADWKRWTDRTRDVFFLILGLGGTANQLFYANPPNPVLYPILAALLGAPFAFALDQRRRDNSDEKE